MPFKIYQNIKNSIFAKFPRIILYPTLKLLNRIHLKKVFRSQSNESQIIDGLMKYNVKNLEVEFFEFGFDPTEFNCAIISSLGCKGTLIDTDAKKTNIGKKILNKNTIIINDKMLPDKLKAYKASNKFFIVSIDIDGNDYEYVANAFSELKPSILISEYNAIFQNKRIKVPFKENFNRHSHHGNYFGASLQSLVDLAHSNSYCLAGVSHSAVNAFFVPSGHLSSHLCKSNLQFGLNQNKIGAVSKQGSRNLTHMFAEISHLPLDNLDHLSRLCTAD